MNVNEARFGRLVRSEVFMDGVDTLITRGVVAKPNWQRVALWIAVSHANAPWPLAVSVGGVDFPIAWMTDNKCGWLFTLKSHGALVTKEFVYLNPAGLFDSNFTRIEYIVPEVVLSDYETSFENDLL